MKALCCSYGCGLDIIDKGRHVCLVLGGAPRDALSRKTVTDGAFNMLEEQHARICLPPDQLHHWRAQDAFPVLARGWSHGGSQTELGELCNNVANTQLIDELLVHELFRRLALFANMLFALWAPLLFAFYMTQMALLHGWKHSMQKNFPGSCAITALGDFNPDICGHLILWDLWLVIRFPPGSTILLPSAIVCHSNVPIWSHERHCSFVQYTMGGLFCWVRNDFKTDEAWLASASRADKAAHAAEDKVRWWKE
ncbi:hypothetical protein C8R45DRAFT_1100778 [Mycena sanguinolenta]|nr:hypothetical protein C8R45DRAFT_1100778 [Mycena sanguinolenta]